MRRRFGLIISAGLALAAAAQLVASGSTSAAPAQPPSQLAILGPRVAVRPGRFVRAYAMCPRGYRVTGGGAYSGAISVIASSPLADLRGWLIDGTNTDRSGRTFTEQADAVCLRAAPPSAAPAPASTASAAAAAAAEPAAWSPGATAGTFERAFRATHRRDR